MSEHSVYGATAPSSGPFVINTDGSPSIRLGETFYTFGTPSVPSGTLITGGRVWTPAGSPAQVRIMLFAGPTATDGVKHTQYNLDTVPVREATVATNPDGWTEARWTGFPVPDPGYRWMIGYEFTGGGATTYITAPGDVASSGQPTVALDGTKIAKAEADDNVSAYAPVRYGYYRLGSGAATQNATTSTYGIDTLVEIPGANVGPVADAGADQTVLVGAQVTLDGSGSTDPDGSITAYAWTQTAGSAVVLSGSGASRTFTPTTSGTRTFQLVVTDNSGATASDSVDIFVNEPSGASTIAEENQKPGLGRPFWFDGVGSEAMPAFGRSTYYLPGQTAQFSIDYNAAFTFDVFRLGHYAGDGARRVAAAEVGTPAAQPAPTVIPGSNGAVTCAAWSVNASWAVPADAVPGWYLILLRGDNGTDFGHVLFCVSDKNAKKPVLVVTGDATWHAAYNGYGGNNVYGASKAIGSSDARAFCSTYDKPVITKDYVGQTHFYNNTYPYLKWSERMGYEAGHTTIEQIKNDPTILDGRQVIVFVGHNEYVPDNVYDKVESLIQAGQRVINIAGNDFFWRVKFTDGAFNSATNGRVMWCKKDTMSGPSVGPDAVPGHVGGQPFTTAADWTGTWQDTRWTGRRPSEDVFGDQFIANGIRNDLVSVPATMKTSPAWRDCPDVQALSAGQSYVFLAGSLGMEWDRPMLGNTSVEQVLFSSTEIDLVNNASDANGEDYGTTQLGVIHGFSMVRNESGLIANFNSDQWAWALDGVHLRSADFTFTGDDNAHQMMLNVLADLGASADSASVPVTLTVPTPVADPFTAYGLTPPDVDPPPPVPTVTGIYYSNGVEWIQIGV